jgi:HD-GYP domain-containing protein (c-di-GMP phosphodiesterase class II)
MGRHSPTRLFFAFAGLTLLLVGAVAGSILLVELPSLRARAERDAATIVSETVTPAVSPAGTLDAAAQRLLGERVSAIRVWSPEGEPRGVAATGKPASIDAGAIDAGAEGLVWFRASTEGRDVLVSLAPLPSGAVLEVQQDYGPIAASIARGQDRLKLVTAAATGGLAIALIVVVAIGFRSLTRDYQRLQYLYRTGQGIRSTLDVTGVLEQLSRDAATFTQAKLSIAATIEERTGDVMVMASYDRQADSAAQHRRKVEEWYLRRCAATGETQAAELQTLPFRNLLGYEPERQKPVSLLCAAIPGRERAIGVIMVVRDLEKGRFSSGDARMVEEMAAQAAMAVEQALLFAKVRSHADELELSYDSTLKVLVAALDTKDSTTHGHSERVAKLTAALAREMGIPEERLLDIERGALLHDVGKIGVPDDILQKPEELDEGEWEAMRKHPLLAGLMISKVGFLEGALPILLYHHERFDGGGYPFSLEGSAIPLEARIFAVVDSYDAMTSDRPYRKAMSHDVALGEIQKNAGRQFDPGVVQAFTRMMDHKAGQAAA